MTKVIRSGVFAAATVCFAVGVVAAQAPPASESSSAKSITVTGCIQRAEKAPTGTSGAADAPVAAAETKFVLKNVMASSSATGTAGTSGTAAEAGPVASEYRLDADDAKLTPHVGHKVEITGVAAKPAGAAPSAASTPKLKVDSVKMVSATCP